MPECLNDGEGLFPGYYDPRYDQTLNPFEPGFDSTFNEFLQSKALEILKMKMSPEKMQDLMDTLKMKGLLNGGIADPAVIETVENYLKKIKMARKIAWQI